jgi:hypothetical protein
VRAFLGRDHIFKPDNCLVTITKLRNKFESKQRVMARRTVGFQNNEKTMELWNIPITGSYFSGQC